MVHSTIKVYLSALRQFHIAEGLRDPGRWNMAKLSQVWRDIQALLPRQPKFMRLLITMEILSYVKEIWDAKRANNDTVMLWAAMLLCFFGFSAQEKYTWVVWPNRSLVFLLLFQWIALLIPNSLISSWTGSRHIHLGIVFEFALAKQEVSSDRWQQFLHGWWKKEILRCHCFILWMDQR